MPATEIVLSEASAAEVEWPIGETRTVGAEAQWYADVPLTLVGTFEAADPDDPYWSRATGILQASIGYDEYGTPYVRVTGYAPPAALETIPSAIGDGVATEVWYPADTSVVTAADAADLLADLRAFVARSHEITTADGFPYATLLFHTGSIDALERSVAQNASLVAVIAMLMSGPLGVALAVLILGCRMLWETRREALALLAARGASPPQLRFLLALDGLLAGIVPAGIGVAVALALRGVVAPGVPVTPLLFALPGILAVLPAVVGAVTATRSRDRRRADGRAASVWRGILEIAVVLLAALATGLLVLRGDATTDAGLDPFAVAGPLLLSLAACVVTLRLYPLGLRLVLRRRQAGRGFVGMLGAARALRDPATGIAPVLALIVGVSFAVAGGVLLSIVQHGAQEWARSATGADLHVEAVRFPSGAAEAIEELDGVAAVAAVDVASAVELSVDHERSRVSLYLVDRAALDDAQQGYPLIVPPGVDLGDGTGMPRLLTSDAVAGRGLQDAGVIEIGMAEAEFAGSIPGIAPFASNTSWALADNAYRDAITERPIIGASIFVRLTSGADADAVADGVRAIAGPGARVVSADDVLAEVESDPAVTGLRLVLLAGIAGCAVLSAVAVVVTLVLGARARRRILALLQTLGAPPRAGTGLLVWELAPVGLSALVVGGAFGAALPLLLSAVIDLRAFTGGALPPAYTIDPLLLTVTLGGFLLVTALVTVVALAVARRARVAAVLRTVEDT
jgi:putative ABC transport system permease protein